MQVIKILAVTPQEKKDLQTAVERIKDLINTGRKFCSDMMCSECPFHNQNYSCPIDVFPSNNIDDDLEEFVNQLTTVKED